MKKYLLVAVLVSFLVSYNNVVRPNEFVLAGSLVGASGAATAGLIFGTQKDYKKSVIASLVGGLCFLGYEYAVSHAIPLSTTSKILAPLLGATCTVLSFALYILNSINLAFSYI